MTRKQERLLDAFCRMLDRISSSYNRENIVRLQYRLLVHVAEHAIKRWLERKYRSFGNLKTHQACVTIVSEMTEYQWLWRCQYSWKWNLRLCITFWPCYQLAVAQWHTTLDELGSEFSFTVAENWVRLNYSTCDVADFTFVFMVMLLHSRVRTYGDDLVDRWAPRWTDYGLLREVFYVDINISTGDVE